MNNGSKRPGPAAWPEYWSNNWYGDDDMYIEYWGGGYYLQNRRYPMDRIAIVVYQS